MCTHVCRFSEADEVVRSPNRLGYSDDIPPIVIEGTWDNTSQDSHRDDYQHLDLRGQSITTSLLS